MAEEVEAGSRIVAIEGGLHGHAGIRRWWSEWFAAFPDDALKAAGASEQDAHADTT